MYPCSSNQLVPNGLIIHMGLNSDLSLSYIKGCRSISEQFRTDTFLDWEGLHWVFTRSLISTHTLSRPLHSLAALIYDIMKALYHPDSVLIRRLKNSSFFHLPRFTSWLISENLTYYFDFNE